jgi:hypothetical protein
MSHTDLLDDYRNGEAAVRDALTGITDAELDHAGPDGGWTPRMVVHHLADSEATAYIRLRRLIAEDAPLIVSYDEELFSRRLHYERPIVASLAVLEAVRAASLELLESLNADEWERAGTHSDSGVYSVETWLRTYVNHPRDHAAQIRAARGGSAV